MNYHLVVLVLITIKVKADFLFVTLIYILLQGCTAETIQGFNGLVCWGWDIAFWLFNVNVSLRGRRLYFVAFHERLPYIASPYAPLHCLFL